MFRMLTKLLVPMLLVLNTLAADIDIPKFTPNVVDATGTLNPSEIVEINQALQKIREKSDIWGAVYLLEDLNSGSIEDIAERAFKKWKLGATQKNNGLLLVLAMKNRQSRFEVGYGLEGDLTDAITRRALDQILRPNMRNNDTKKAIIDSFNYLAAVRSKDPSVTELEREMDDSFTARGSWPALAIYLFCIWLLRPITAAFAIVFARRLARTHSAFHIEKDKKVNQGRLTPKYLMVGDFGWGALFLRGFFSINPGAFIFLGAGFEPLVFYGIFLVSLLTIIFYFRSFAGRYWSPKSYQAYLGRLRKRNEKLMSKGYMRETSPGEYEFTKSYYSSSEYRSSSSSGSSSRSSSSSSSSSGGGSSGGGGASSSW
jgi:uncharacterized protein